MIALVAPMATELSGVRRAIRNPAERGVALSVSGIGRARIQACIRLLAEPAPEAIILLGFCGGADSSLRAADLHVADQFQAPGTGDAITSDAELAAIWSEAARDSGARVVSGPSATVDFVATATHKSELHRSSCIASVNMEDYWAAETARDFGVPFLSVRAVLDDAATELPARLPANPDSTISALANLARHPGQLPAMLHLVRLACAARNSLTRCALAAIERGAISRSALQAVDR